jgi:hypothetical protein
MSEDVIKGQMSLFDFIKPEPEQIPMYDYLKMLGYRNSYEEAPNHECIAEVVDVHEYPKLHFYKTSYVYSFGNIVQEIPKHCGYSCVWWKEIKPLHNYDESVCEGCKWRYYPGKFLEVNEYGDTWAYRCPGTACANWPNGTPMNISHINEDNEYLDTKESHCYCWNREWWPGKYNICKHADHVCNKKELWKIADTLDDIKCPHVCCRKCDIELCGARCNGTKK